MPVGHGWKSFKSDPLGRDVTLKYILKEKKYKELLSVVYVGSKLTI